MKVRKPRVNLRLLLSRLNNILYLVAMWLCLTCAASLFVGDIIYGAGIVSAVVLFFVLKGKQQEEYVSQQIRYMEELERRLGSDGKPNEEKRF